MFKRLLSAFFSFALLGTASGISSAGVTVPDVLKDRIALKKTAQQLNVVYFLGSDTEPVPDYERRLSELLLYLQQFYGREMQRHGYGARSFGLDIKSPGRVNIIEYKAKNPAAHYPYENGGGWKAAQELEEFFKANPDRKKSQHTLVIMPTWNDEKNGPDNPGGVPFYGMGRNCFALDYPAFDIKHLGQKTREGQLLTKWCGGPRPCRSRWEIGMPLPWTLGSWDPWRRRRSAWPMSWATASTCPITTRPPRTAKSTARP